MPIPVVAIVAGTAIATGTSLVLSPIVNWANAAQTATNYETASSSWWDNPGIEPAATGLLDLYNRGLIDHSLTQTLLRRQGISWKDTLVVGQGPGIPDGNRYVNRTNAWDRIRIGMFTPPSISFVLGLYGRGYYDGNHPGFANAIKQAGGNPDVWRQFAPTMYQVPEVSTLLVMRNRELISDDVFDEKLKKLGYGFAGDRRAIKALRHISPNASDLIHFAVKEAFSVGIANDVLLYDEYPQEITPYLRDIGLDWDMGFNIVADGVERPATIGDMHWASHWQPISPGQAYEMFHRYRPDRLARFAAAGVQVNEFPLADVERWLRINDYPKSVRNQLLGLSFSQLRLFDIRQALTLAWRVQNEEGFADGIPPAIAARLRQYNRAWGIAQFRDRGVLPEDAATQVDTVYAMAAGKAYSFTSSTSKASLKVALSTILKAYQSGIMERLPAFNALRDIGLTEKAANTYLDAEDYKTKQSVVAAAVKSLRRGLLTGQLTAQECLDRLQNTGMNYPRARQYVAIWASEFTANRKQLATSKIIEWTGKGTMTPDDARRRLTNIGWSEPDIMLYMAEAEQKSVQLRAGLAKAIDASRLKQLQALAKIERDAEKNLADARQARERLAKIATLQRWLRKKEITHDQFIAEMAVRGYPRNIAELYAKDAITPEPKAITPPSTTGKSTPQATSPATPQSESPGTQQGTTQQPLTQPQTDAERRALLASQGLRADEAATTPGGQIVLNTQPQQLNTQPERLNTQPERLNPSG